MLALLTPESLGDPVLHPLLQMKVLCLSSNTEPALLRSTLLRSVGIDVDHPRSLNTTTRQTNQNSMIQTRSPTRPTLSFSLSRLLEVKLLSCIVDKLGGAVECA